MPCLLAAAALSALALPARAAIPITAASVLPSDARAGAHPDLTITTELSQSQSVFGDDVRDLNIELPPGLIGNPRAVPRCSLASFQADSCPGSTQVGSVSVNATTIVGFFLPLTADSLGSVYNLDAEPNQPARLGIWVRPQLAIFPLEKFSLLVPVRVRPDRGYGLDAAMTGMPRSVSGSPLRINRVRLTLDGIVGGAAFMTNPTSCLTAITTVQAVSYEDPDSPSIATASFTPTDCGSLPFSTGLSVLPDADLAESPTGAEIALTASGSELPRRHAHARAAVVDLPPGMALNPGLAAGLQSCDEQAFLAGQACPAASDLGDVLLSTPPLGEVPGDIFLATPSGEHTWRLLLELRLPGAVGRLVGDIALDPADGRIRTSFANLPQVPFTSLVLRFAGGPRGTFLTPSSCGVHTAGAQLEPWTRPASATPPDAAPSATFTTSYEDGGCPEVQPFAPQLSAAFDSREPSLSLRLERPDRHQRIAGMTVGLPGALLDLVGLGRVERCALDAAARGSCAQASRLGTVTALVGAGPQPLSLGGQLYVTEPRVAGDLAGVSISLPGRVGPVDLGQVIVPGRVLLGANGPDVVAEALPQIQAGVPLPLRALELKLDRKETLASSRPCGGRTVHAEIRGSAGAVAQRSADVEFPACVAGRRAGRPRARLSLRFRGRRGLLRGRVRAVKGAPALSRVAIRLPRGLDRRRKVLVFKAPRGGQRRLRVRAGKLVPTAALARSLGARRGPPRLRFRLRVRDTSGRIFSLRVRVRPKLGRR